MHSMVAPVPSCWEVYSQTLFPPGPQVVEFPNNTHHGGPGKDEEVEVHEGQVDNGVDTVGPLGEGIRPIRYPPCMKHIQPQCTEFYF